MLPNPNKVCVASCATTCYAQCQGGEQVLAAQIATRTEYDKVIQETEGAYIKILESSQTLLTVLKRESVSIQKKRQTSS